MKNAVATLCAAALLTQQATCATPKALQECRSYWLWAGVAPQTVLDGAKRIYLLQSEVGKDGKARSMRPAVPHVMGAQVWAVVRAGTLAWRPEAYDATLASLRRWRAKGNDVVGLQVDFDSGTRRLGEYIAFLRNLKDRLPAGMKLGATGLLDAANASDADLKGLAATVDEVIVQTYQGRRTTPGYGAYVDKLAKAPIHFKIGVVQGGPWTQPESLDANPRFEGYVIFLTNTREGRRSTDGTP